jgi:dTMP kinase
VLSGLGCGLKGLFITFEGLDGCGKSTQMELLAAALADRGYVVTVTREPGGTPLGEAIRDLLLDPRHHGMSPRAEALLYAAARAHLVEQVIRPALEDGQIVLCDRYIDSSLAYQGYGRGLGTDYIMLVNDWGTAGLFPDLTLFLDLDDSVRSTRLAAVPDRLEAEDDEFHRRVAQGFRELLQTQRHRIRRIDATGGEAEVQGRVRAIIEEELELFSH